jgi:hypothetical protein
MRILRKNPGGATGFNCGNSSNSTAPDARDGVSGHAMLRRNNRIAKSVCSA